MIKVRHAIKHYGREQVLSDVSASFPTGRIHGLVGRNGSGKTVLLKCISGLVPLSGGSITIEGKRIGRDIEMPPSMGAIIETPGFLPNYSGYNNLAFLAGIKGRIGKQQIRDAMGRVGLDPDSRKWVSKYSLGMRQRLGIAQAIMEDPDLLILDEPMNGLDNQGVKEIRRLLLALRAQGKTILLASHDPVDIEELCDRVYEMDAGKIERVR